eukprot:CAMPEP_0201572604 /NCGR_PEP_ID=MMETSP0190_2-20130828/15983_1 /ASSEMBLY_ACC=CAM_ASM_000263 /TAXON_ID=37353 /ORGANISM="Rosalina sp." /LENGTH=230 /DNA_ID=CAMNT_0047998589 /DNA_START=85 /DNA_END=777 /DNA_ORIENTATION=-
MQRVSAAWTDGILCANAIKATAKHQSNADFYIRPGYRRINDECHAPLESERIDIKWRTQNNKWMNLKDPICYQFYDDTNPCVMVREKDWTSADDWGRKFIFPDDFKGFEDGDEFIVSVEIKKGGLDGSHDGTVEIRMYKYVPPTTKAPTPKPPPTTRRPTPWPTPKPVCDPGLIKEMPDVKRRLAIQQDCNQPQRSPTPRPPSPTPKPAGKIAIDPDCAKRRLLEPLIPC